MSYCPNALIQRIHIFPTFIGADVFLYPINNRVLKETAVSQVLKEKSVVQETLVLRVLLVSLVSK